MTAGPSPDGPVQVLMAKLGELARDPLLRLAYLLDSLSKWLKDSHIHPFLSLDGRTGFLNSNEPGVLQAYMTRNLPV